MQCYVLLQRRCLEVVVHGVGPRKQLLKVLEADVQRDGQANCGPQRVATTHPLNTRHEGTLRMPARVRTSQNSNMFLVSMPNLATSFCKTSHVGWHDRQ